MDENIRAVAIIGTFIPIVLILCFPLIAWVFLKFRSKHQADIQVTLRTMIENGQTVSPELLEKMQGVPLDKKEKDLRWGVIFIAIGIGWALMGIMSEGFEGDYKHMFDAFGYASIWLLIGLARLGLWKYMPDSTINRAE